MDGTVEHYEGLVVEGVTVHRGVVPSLAAVFEHGERIAGIRAIEGNFDEGAEEPDSLHRLRSRKQRLRLGVVRGAHGVSFRFAYFTVTQWSTYRVTLRFLHAASAGNRATGLA